MKIMFLIAVTATMLAAQNDSADVPFEQVAVSPCIAALQKGVEAGDSASVARFWNDLPSNGGTPIVEKIPADSRNVLVTFVWRAQQPVKAVMLLAQLNRGRNPAESNLSQLAGTDVWYRAYRLRNDLRFTYSFVPDPPPSTYMAVESRKLDPYNHKQAMGEKDPENPSATVLGGSLAEMPNAPPQPWINRQPGTPVGKVEMQRLHSTILNNDRRIWIYTPAGYDAKTSTPYPLLICFDGGAYSKASEIGAPIILDNLITQKKIPAMLAVFIENPQATRLAELTNHQAFVDFLANELLPWAHKNWNITSDPKRTVVCGLSAGGLTSAYVAFRRPHLFGNVLSQSGAYWRGNEGGQDDVEWLTQQYKNSPKLPIRFVLQVGVLEVAPAPNGVSIRDANRHLKAVLQAKGYEIDYTEEPGGHEYVSWRGGLPEGLMFLMGARN